MNNSIRLTLSGTLSGLMLIVAPLACRAHGNEHGQAKAVLGTAKVSVEYNRPELKGRDLSKLIQPGQLWRIGADSPTTIESDADLDFNGTRVGKGKYILLARFVEPGKWTLVFSTKPASQYKPDAKVAEVPLELQQGADAVETVTIRLAENAGQGILEIAWGTLRLRANFAASK